MAQVVSVSIYGFGDASGEGRAVSSAYGVTMGFPVQGIRVEPVVGISGSDAVTFNNVTMNSVIQLLPSGLNQKEKRYYSPTAVATIITAANT